MIHAAVSGKKLSKKSITGGAIKIFDQTRREKRMERRRERRGGVSLITIRPGQTRKVREPLGASLSEGGEDY